MFYFTIHQNVDKSYVHNEIRFYGVTNYSTWNKHYQIASVMWQGDDHNSGFYGFRAKLAYQAENNLETIEEFGKLMKKLEPVFGFSPNQFIEFLFNTRGFKFSIYDYRIDEIVTVEQWVKTENETCYKVIVDGTYICDVLAWGENEARKTALKTLSDNGEFARLEKFVTHGSIEPKNVRYVPYMTDVMKWVTNPLER